MYSDKKSPMKKRNSILEDLPIKNKRRNGLTVYQAKFLQKQMSEIEITTTSSDNESLASSQNQNSSSAEDLDESPCKSFNSPEKLVRRNAIASSLDVERVIQGMRRNALTIGGIQQIDQAIQLFKAK